jgi:FkbM family methyltransferase
MGSCHCAPSVRPVPTNNQVDSVKAVKNFFKFGLLPKSLYLAASARLKKRRTLRKRWGETELELLPMIVPPGKLAVDIGANNGLYTYFLSRVARHVVAYEPIPVLAQFLRRAVAANVSVREKAVSDRAGKMDIHVPVVKGHPTYNIGSLDAAHNTGPCITYNIEVTTLDEEDLSDVGFIKIDIEGHELSALRGAENTIRRDRPTILLEVLDTQDWESSALAFLSNLGYEIFVYEDRCLRHSSFSEQDKAGRNFVCFAKRTG